MIDFLSAKTLAADPCKAREAWCSCPSADGVQIPLIHVPRHIVPVELDEYGVAMLVPLRLRPAEEWSLRGVGEATSSSNEGGIIELLSVAERTWSELPGRKQLPLRWRRPFAISAECALSYQSIEEASFELPVVVAVLRELAVSLPGLAKAEVPFGNGPVFATGSIQDDGAFGEAGALTRKLEAFLREAPSDSAALLTPKQISYLTAHGPESLAAVRAIPVDSLTSLLQLPDFAHLVECLQGPPHPSEVDELLWNMDRLARATRFSDAAGIANWLLLHVNSPFYRARLLLHAGARPLHEGRLSQVSGYSNEIRGLLSSNDVGAEYSVRAAAYLAAEAFETAEWEHGMDLLQQLDPKLPHCSAAGRARFFGVRSKLLRALKRWDDAVESASIAFHLTERAAAADAGMALNLLIHSLLRRGSALGRDQDFDRATALLHLSATTWTPLDDENRRLNHLGFCRHLGAERARLLTLPYRPEADPASLQPPGHSWIFELLACTRNRAHEHDLRVQYGQRLLDATDEYCTDSSGLPAMFVSVYRIYIAVLVGRCPDMYLADLRLWCQRQHVIGTGGWSKAFGELLQSRTLCAAWAERLCDCIPHH